MERSTRWLVTATPTYTAGLITIVSLPIFVHVFPSIDRYDVKTEPARTRRIQPGGAPAPPAVLSDNMPGPRRRWNAYPFPEETKVVACVEFAASVSRIMTPTLDQLSAKLIKLTCATTSRSPLTCS